MKGSVCGRWLCINEYICAYSGSQLSFRFLHCKCGAAQVNSYCYTVTIMRTCDGAICLMSPNFVLSYVQFIVIVRS